MSAPAFLRQEESNFIPIRKADRRQTLYMALRAAARRLRCPLSYRLHALAFSTSASSPTKEQLLASTDLQSLLQRHSKTVDDPVQRDPAFHLELLSHFSHATGHPVASDALSRMQNAAEMANWFAVAVRPSKARRHARGLIVATLGQKDGDIDEEIDLHRENVQEELMRSLPGNLQLDPKTFRAPTKAGIGDKRVFARPQVKRKIVKRARKAQLDAEWRAAAGL